jgi:hypothetical protein
MAMRVINFIRVIRVLRVIAVIIFHRAVQVRASSFVRIITMISFFVIILEFLVLVWLKSNISFPVIMLRLTFYPQCDLDFMVLLALSVRYSTLCFFFCDCIYSGLPGLLGLYPKFTISAVHY